MTVTTETVARPEVAQQVDDALAAAAPAGARFVTATQIVAAAGALGVPLRSEHFPYLVSQKRMPQPVQLGPRRRVYALPAVRSALVAMLEAGHAATATR